MKMGKPPIFRWSQPTADSINTSNGYISRVWALGLSVETFQSISCRAAWHTLGTLFCVSKMSYMETNNFWVSYEFDYSKRKMRISHRWKYYNRAFNLGKGPNYTRASAGMQLLFRLRLYLAFSCRSLSDDESSLLGHRNGFSLLFATLSRLLISIRLGLFWIIRLGLLRPAVSTIGRLDWFVCVGIGIGIGITVGWTPGCLFGDILNQGCLESAFPSFVF
jgi:hypothetical protein